MNNAANDDDISNGTLLARVYGIKVTPPKFGASQSEYSYNPETKEIAKGLSSIKFIGEKLAISLYEMSRQHEYTYFSDVLADAHTYCGIDARQLDILIRIDFFSKFGNQRELKRIVDLYDMFSGASQIKKKKIEGSYFEEIVAKYANGLTKTGKEAASWTIIDNAAIIHDCEKKILSLDLPDMNIVSKVRSFAEAMGYAGYISGSDEDRAKLYIRKVFPVKRKKDGKQFGYSILTQSIGSGKESRFTIFNPVFDADPIKEGDVILCKGWRRDNGGYFTMTAYKILRGDDMDEIEEETA